MEQKKKFFKKFKENVKDHIDENQNITYQKLVEEVGSPKDIMISYIQDCDDSYIIHKMNLKKLMKQVFITFSISLIIGLLIICYFEWRTIEESKNQQIITNEIILEEE